MYKVNISIDDISPHPLSSTRVLDSCYQIIEEAEDVKFSLFIPISYWRTEGPTKTEEPLQIDKFPEFCEKIKSLPDKNFEIAYHGFYHGIPQKSNNDEFQHLNYEQAMEKFELMDKVVTTAGLKEKFKPYFRPPAWRMSKEAIQAAQSFGYEILALSPKEYAKETYGEEDEKFEKVVFYNVNPPFDPLQLLENTQMVYHACEWDKNYLSYAFTRQLKSLLVENEEEIEFCFLKELL
jgi:peptidoglycan/xylan/chitin deacetylase (PgdA/CDA1 family)